MRTRKSRKPSSRGCNRADPKRLTLPCYVATWVDDLPGVTVTRGSETTPLDLRLDLERLSPTGFGWGYLGPGSAQLALAILADFHAELPSGDERARLLYRGFQSNVVAALGRVWSLSGERIADYLAITAL